MKKVSSHLIFSGLVLCISFSPALAENRDPAPKHGVAMHGDVKYDEGEPFDYVNTEAPQGGTLRRHAVGSFDTLNPFIVKGSEAAGLSFLGSSLLHQSLMIQSYDEPFSMYGLVAESIELPESNEWVAFNLREAAQFHDGEPIRAGDVVWTFNQLMEHGSPFYKAYWGDVEKVEATDELRVKFTFKDGENSELPLILSQMPVLPKHFYENGDHDLTKTTLKAPLGSGPYKIAEVEPGRRIVYERVDDWWAEDLALNAGRYNFDRVTYDYYRDNNVALEAFLAGEYDIRQENTAKQWATSYDVSAVENGDIKRAEIKHSRPAGMQAFIYNTRRDMFKDERVREALAYAFDFEWSNKKFAYGEYKRTDSYFENSELAARNGPAEGRVREILKQFDDDKLPPGTLEKDYQPPTTDGAGNNRENLRKAAKLLEEAGYVLNDNGVREHEDTGKTLDFTILESNPAFERWTMPFIKNLKRIGVEASFRQVDSAQYQNRLNSFEYDMTIMSLPQSSSPGNEQRDFWHSRNAETTGSRNYMGIQSAVVDKLIDMVINAPSREELVARVRALDRVLLHGHYVIPQWHNDEWWLAYDDKLTRPETMPDLSPAITSTWWVGDQENSKQ